ncbi:Metapyrocatechase 2 [Cyphellophora attinorum]|uniref:Metapyrocatechase 2 n=1 Tax=Cyphellophora attinorum TaxID=1664694 RepID=A0A0N0NQV4_9EURO|nr:Metapyrocatechase 2 [Phialophora attinorum]KPI44109.1 Metapyrocatechase 2 [Phialophora attinorum]
MNNRSKVQLSRLAHVYFEHPDLEEFEKFAIDFGFVEAKRSENTTYLRGYGRDQYVYVASKSMDGKAHFRGAAFVAASEDDFNKARELPNAVAQTLEDAPGGGIMVTLSRPENMFLHIIYGQAERDVPGDSTSAVASGLQASFNTPFQKRRRGVFQRPHDGPALVHKLGHFGYNCTNFDTELEFYTSNFNLVPSDILYHPGDPSKDVMVFLHLDQGEIFSDHHSFFMSRASPDVRKTYLHHTSYEVTDFDTQLMGHQWLAKRNWKSVWGVGRHILGSQIFDYWQDPSGFKIEHYADGDVVNEATPVRRDAAGPFSIWGPEIPHDFGQDSTETMLDK